MALFPRLWRRRRSLYGHAPAPAVEIVSMRTVFARPARVAGIAAVLLSLPLSMPALADEAAAVNTFKPITRAQTPGDRAAAQSYARPGSDAAAAAALALSGDDTSRLANSGISLSVNGNLPAFSSGYGTRRSNQLLGDGQIGYEAEPFYSNNHGYYNANGVYSTGTPRLNYNESFLRYKYGGNILGAPSVSAPLGFWDGRR